MYGALRLEDGSIFLGKFFGYESDTRGEVVFSTGMVGYPQSLTDPSFSGQILVFTYPLIGNYGVPGKLIQHKILSNFESEKIQVRAVVVSSAGRENSHWQSAVPFHDWLSREKIPGLELVDTRILTQKLREKGVMLGIITRNKNLPFADPYAENLVAQASCRKPVIYQNGRKKVLLIDCGVKHSIIRKFYDSGITIIRVPWDFDPEKSEKVDGVVISNGPGDPKILKKTIKSIEYFMEKKIPILGVCLGNQLLALAAGGDTYKLKYGHRSLNQPVRQCGTEKAFITSQNHGFCVRMETLDSNWEEWFTNCNDNTNEGIRHKLLPFSSVQFHPEGNPGPQDTGWVIEDFVKKL